MKIFFYAIALLLVGSCTSEKPADLIIHHADIYTVDTSKVSAEAIAIRDGRFIYVGDEAGVDRYKGSTTKVIDAEGKFLMPGFIEGHGHLSSLGSSLMNLNFSKSKSWDSIVAMVAEKVKTAKPGEWILGFGWHQEKWTQPLFASVHGYPMHDALSAISPDNPILLTHASGHGVFVNKKAMDLAGVTKETPDPSGGSIVRDDQGNAIGMFEETSQRIVRQAYKTYLETRPPDEFKQNWHQGITLAQQECIKNGVTSFEDAGSSFQEIEWYKNLAEKDSLNIRLWAMIRAANSELTSSTLNSFPMIGIGKEHFTVRAVKKMVDGALGSYGAWLLDPYSDRQDKFYGQNTSPISDISEAATICIDHDLQLCVHGIGDRANREVLNIMQSQFNDHPDKKDLRWRIEHSQHLDTADIPRFAQLGVIAAMQGIHCTSDAPFVVKRLGEFRARTGAYPWRSLLKAGAIVTNGTDVPVESINPIECYYATVTRARADNGMIFYPEQKMTRAEGIYSYTMANAYAAFEEKNKGSITVGKWADFILLSNDLIHCADSSILSTKVLKTFVGGKELN